MILDNPMRRLRDLDAVLPIDGREADFGQNGVIAFVPFEVYRDPCSCLGGPDGAEGCEARDVRGAGVVQDFDEGLAPGLRRGRGLCPERRVDEESEYPLVFNVVLLVC